MTVETLGEGFDASDRALLGAGGGDASTWDFIVITSDTSICAPSRGAGFSPPVSRSASRSFPIGAGSSTIPNHPPGLPWCGYFPASARALAERLQPTMEEALAHALAKLRSLRLECALARSLSAEGRGRGGSL